MKTNLLFRPLLVVLLLSASLAAAGPRPTRSAPVQGYWNVETNLLTRDYSIIRFFNDQDQLVYEERIDNLCLDLSSGSGLCRRTANQLNVALQQVLLNPAAPQQNPTMLAQQFGQNRRVQRVYAVR
ncbi:hypothetical protein E5K00_06150 [Hymenobacter aquaticus]|uniref:Uncharacterized protein n=1 Tax=Hymenobacter aquaticus TaxID=1867101 RepID=A0A4Z0Q596_9BACT|nr:hypothetical protein [Hymenobacter aquaticus]TGE24784.1 hypothetical protein E5K00_06150 [Hymenobacter aquaticus]